MAALTTTAMLALSAAKTAGTFMEQRKAASMAQQQGDAQGSLLDRQATLATAQADDARRRGALAVGDEQVRGSALAGAQVVAGAAAGLDVSAGSGSSLQDVILNDRRLSVLDQATLRQNAQREAWGYETRAGMLSAEAQWARAAGTNRAAGLRRGSVGTLLTGAGELANIYSSAPKGLTSRGGPTSALPSGWEDDG